MGHGHALPIRHVAHALMRAVSTVMSTPLNTEAGGLLTPKEPACHSTANTSAPCKTLDSETSSSSSARIGVHLRLVFPLILQTPPQELEHLRNRIQRRFSVPLRRPSRVDRTTGDRMLARPLPRRHDLRPTRRVPRMRIFQVLHFI